MLHVRVKNSVLYQEIKEDLRNEIKREIQQEMLQQESKKKPWECVRDYIEDNLPKNMNRWDTYKIQTAIYTLIRFSLRISRVEYLRVEQVRQAIDVADSCLQTIIEPEVPLSNG